MSETGFDSSDELIARRVEVQVEPITYRFEGGMLLTTMQGPTSYQDVKRYLDALFADPQFRPGLPGLIDCRRVESRFSISDLRRTAADLRDRPEMRTPSKAAVIATSNLVYGLLRMYEVFSEGDPVQIRVFRKPEEAMDWLRAVEEE